MACSPPHQDTTLSLSLLPFSPPKPPPLPRKPRPEAVPRVRSSPSGETPPCTECGKRFPSWKALFGHMRCHPERQWRGITPPPHFRRAADAHHFTAQEREVAASLLMLAGPRPCAGKARKATAAGGKDEGCGVMASPAAAAVLKCDDHKCSVCDRGFASGQALGGHKRCHWERACTEVVFVGGGSGSGTASAAVAKATGLDLNLPPPPAPPLVQRSGMLDLKLGY